MKLTKEQIQSALPDKSGKQVTQALVDHINKIASDADFRKYYRENLLNYNTVLQDGKYTVTAYMNAVMYVSYKMMGYKNIDAFERTFPEKIARYAKERKRQEDIHNFVSAYNRTKLVVALTEKARVPAYILNMDIHQESIEILANIARNGKNEIARVKAASDLMNYLTPPEDNAIKVNIGIEHTYLDNMKDVVKDLVKKQQLAVGSGMITPAEAANMRVIEGDVVEVE